MKKYYRIALTTGDIKGIGSEVTSKALSQLKPQRGISFYMWRSPLMAKSELKLIDRQFKRVTVRSWPEALRVPVSNHKTIVDIESLLPPARWVETMGKSGLSGSIDALVTAPLSKTEIINSGMRDNGHTGILKRVTKSKSVYMCFLGKHMNVVLMTGHVSLKKAYEQINTELLENCIEHSSKVIKSLPLNFQSRPIGLVGCNPHCGEAGIIDKKEMEIYEPVVKKFRTKRLKISNSLVPDVCFQENQRKKYSIYIASYHDQGLIPFKMLHGTQTGVQYSLGLPFIRTSVDHGTATDIFGKNKADCGSMKSAISSAIRLVKHKPLKW